MTVVINPAPSKPEVSCFRTTRWTMIREAVDDQDPQRASDALEILCHAYWRPVYIFVLGKVKDPERAKDYTQSFFGYLLDKGLFAKANRDLGRFRSFLLSSVENFLSNEWAKERAVKRGGAATIIPFDAPAGEVAVASGWEGSDDPSRKFDRQWGMALLDRAMGRWRQESGASRDPSFVEHIESHLWSDAERLNYNEVAARFGMGVSNVKVVAFRMRARFKEIPREEVSATVASPEEVDDEIRWLVDVMRRPV